MYYCVCVCVSVCGFVCIACAQDICVLDVMFVCVCHVLLMHTSPTHIPNTPLQHTCPLPPHHRWLPPEVLTGDAEVTAATDVYAFGIILWEVATLQEPFGGLGLEQVLCAVAIRKEHPPLVAPSDLLGGTFAYLDMYYDLMKVCVFRGRWGAYVCVGGVERWGGM